MSENIVNKEYISFKEIEKEIYVLCCEYACRVTRDILETMDEELSKARDKKEYRDKGYRKTSIKTVYGEVEYSRHAYISKNEDGKNETIYLLDKELGMDTIGLISTNLAEKITKAVVDAPFRKAAELVSETTGQTISHSGVWNVVQKIGSKIEIEENNLVKEFRGDKTTGKKEVPVLFEEMDGVWLKCQGKGASKAKGMEVKVGTMYEGWEKDTGKRSVLYEKTMYAGIEDGETFREKWESKIQSIYNPNKIKLRIFNGDGGSWVYDEYDANNLKQLDRFHAIKAIRDNTSHEEMRKDMLELLEKDKISELVELAEIYYNSICTAEGTTSKEKAAKDLWNYLSNHKEELSRYRSRGAKIPEPPKDVEYKNMGVQENQNCTLITLRMKGKRKRWAPKSANNMIRLLYYKENKELIEAIDRYTDGKAWVEPVENKFNAPLSAAQTALVDGKGNNRYYDTLNKHLLVLDSSNSRTASVFRRLIN